MLLFLSYADEDDDIAQEIADRLRSEHVSVYAPRDKTVTPGVTSEDPERAIQQADAFLTLLSPDSLTSASCRRERDLALHREQSSETRRVGADFVRVLQIRDTPYHPAGPLRSQPWFDLTEGAARRLVISDLAGTFASTGDHGSSDNGTAGAGNGGQPPPPSPYFENQKDALTDIRDGVTSRNGERFWLLLASPQHGKSWLLRQLSMEVSSSRRNWWKVTWVDVRELTAEIAGNAGAVLQMMLGQPRDDAGSVNVQNAVDGILDKGPYFLCLLDSAEMLDDNTVLELRRHLDQISKELGKRRRDARLAVIAASRRDQPWAGLEPARPPQIKRLREFSVDVVTEALEKLARRTGRGMTPELHQHAERIHRQSEGLPRLLTECLKWTAGHWDELNLLDDWTVFREIARPYVDDILLSTDSLRGLGRVPTNQQQGVMRHAFQLLSVFRLFSGSHLSHLADRDELRDTLTRVRWSVGDLRDAVSVADLVYRPRKGIWMAIDRPIGRLLFRYCYSSEAERARINAEALAFLQRFTSELSGGVAADMLVECLWHKAQVLVLTEDPTELEASMIGLAAHLSAHLQGDGSADIDFVRDYAAKRIREDFELGKVLGVVRGLLHRVAMAVLRPEPEQS